MEGQARLRRIELGLQIAHASLAILEHFDDAQAGRVGKRVKQRHGAFNVGGGMKSRSHIRQYINQSCLIKGKRQQWARPLACITSLHRM